MNSSIGTESLGSCPGAVSARLPLTASQTGMWRYQQLDASNPSGRAAEYIEIRGPLNTGLLRDALNRAVLDTQALRVRVEEDEEGRPWQVTAEPTGALPGIDLRDRKDPQAAATAWMREDLTRPLDIRYQDPLSAALLRTEDACHLLYISVHHVALDGYGFSLFVKHLADLYTALEGGLPLPPADWPALGELLADEEEYRRSPRWEEDRAYWEDQQRGSSRSTMSAARLKALPHLPLRVTGHVPPSTADALRARARASRTSLPPLAMAALALYIHRLAGRDDVTLELTVTGRTGKVARAVPAMLANILPLTVRCDRDTTVGELIREAALRARGLLRHQRFPAGQLDRDLGAVKPGGYLSDWGANFMGYDPQLTFGSCPALLHNLSNGPCEGMGINIYERSADGSLRIDFNADPGVYDPAEVRAHHRRFLALLETLATTDADTPVASIDLVTPQERQRLLHDWNDTALDVADTPLPELIQRHGRSAADTVAVVCGTTTLTYGELNTRANRLARLLVDRGAGPQGYVALALPRTAEYVVALLAVLKSGAACVPLDPGHPTGRIRHMLAETRPVCVLAPSGTTASFGDSPVVHVDAADTGRTLARLPATDLSDRDRVAPLLPHHPAYVSYTSGSSGAPKGVVVEHRSLTNLYADHERELIAPAARAAGRPLRAALTAAFTFDTSWEGPLFLAAGQELHVIDDQVRLDPEAMCAYADTHGIDFLDVTPSYLRQLLAGGLLSGGRGPGLLMVGGEPMDTELWQELRAHPETVAYNYYGPTECTVDAVYCRLDEHGDTPVLGRPGHNVRAHVLDRARGLLPPGVPGELYLAGPQVAREYLGQPSLTAEQFVPDPFAGDGTRMYRTGDVVRRRDDGVLEFLGRADDQLALHGCRIEPGEIEAVLNRHPRVAQAAVALRRTAGGEDVLAAFVVPRADRLPEGLRAWAQARLPQYMVPALCTAVESLPLTPHGKLDRTALPEIASGTAGRAAAGVEEKALAALFAEVLGVPDVGLDDDFFAIGGNSLSAARLAGRTRTELGHELTIGAIFAAPTVAELSRHLTADRAPDSDPFGMLLPLRTQGQQPPLFCIHPAGGLGWCYASLPHQLDPDRPVYALQAPGLSGSGDLPDTFEEMIDAYVAQVRAVQPSGPYHFLGWSLGGALAHAVAARLQSEGERVDLLAMLDSRPLRWQGRTLVPGDTVAARGLLLEAAGRPSTTWQGGSDAASGTEENRFRDHFVPEQKVSAMTEVLVNYGRIGKTFTTAVFDGDVLFFEATSAGGGAEPVAPLWKPWVTGDVDSYTVPAPHQDMLQREPLSRIGHVVAQRLAVDA